MKQKIVKWITPVVFLVLIFGMAVANLLSPTRGFSESENRYLKTMPKFSWKTLLDGTFTADFEKFLTDQFIGRDSFIGVKTESEYLLGKRDTNSVYFGKKGYLLEKKTSHDLDEQLEKNLGYLEEFTERAAAELGAGHVRVLMAPTASLLEADKLPAYAPIYDQQAVLDELESRLPEGVYVDAAGVLQAHAGEELYYRTDHHWTTLGAFYGYQAYKQSLGLPVKQPSDFTTEVVSESFYGTHYSKARLVTTRPDRIIRWLPKTPQGGFQVDYNGGQKQSDSLYDESFLSKRDQYSYFLGGNNALVTIRSSNPNGKHLLLVKDSYAHSMVPFFADEYESIHMVDLRYYNGKLSEYIPQEGITDVLVLYNTTTFTSDIGVPKMAL